MPADKDGSASSAPGWPGPASCTRPRASTPWRGRRGRAPRAPGWQDAARNWVADGPEMLDQKHGVRPADWEAGLAWIGDILDGIEADWFLIGSAALAVRGMDVVLAASMSRSTRPAPTASGLTSEPACYGP